MAIKGNYSDGSGVHENVTLKLTRIWGSKSENWNAWVVVLAKESDVKPITTFSIQAPYVDGENPYPALYNALMKLDSVQNAKSDVVPEPVQQPKVKSETTEEVVPKRPRVRKVIK